MAGVHSEFAFAIAWPLRLRTVAIELNSVLIGIAQVKRLAHAVIGGSIQRNPRLHHAAQRGAQCGAGGIKECEVLKAGCPWSRRRSAFALPGIESDVVVVTARGDERGRVAH